MLDMLIQNGHVVDPATHRNEICDVAIHNGKIVDAAQYAQEGAAEVVDASGCYVTPGLIDFHAHLFTDGCERGVYPESTYFPNGVTTAVDAGSAGVANYASFYNWVATPSKVRMLSYLNVCSLGLGTVTYQENMDPKCFNKEKIAQYVEKYGDNIKALKLRQSKNIVGQFGLEPLRATRALADELHIPVVVHVTDSPGQVRDTLDLLRPGDIYCHIFHGKGNTALGPDGKILPEILEARERGILFDAAHGGNQFCNRVARAAIDQGFLPDFISSDISLKTMYRPPLFSMGMVMSKFLNFGIPLETLIEIVTVNAAKWLHLEGSAGTLAPGACADVAILRLEDKAVRFDDSHGDQFTGTKVLKTEMTLREGLPVFRQLDF